MSTAESDEVALDRCLKLSVMNWMPFMIIVGSSPPYRFLGSMVHVMDIIAERLNLCYEFVIPDDWMFGTRLPNGSWTGIMGQLERGETDMSGVTMSNDAARNAAVDFSEPLYMDTQVLSYKRPVLEADIAGFIKPYDALMWILLAASMLVVLVAFFCVHLRENSLSFKRNNKDKKQTPELDTERKVLQEQKWESVWYSFQWTIGSTLAQSIPWMPRGNAVRVIAGLWLFSALIIASVYRSNLKAMLILPKLKLPFDSMEELVETDIPCNVPKGSMLYQAVLYAPPGSLLARLKDKLIDTIDKDKAIKDLLSGVNAIFMGKIIIEFVVHQTFSQTRTCPLYIAPQTFFGATSLSIGFKKGSPLKAKVDPVQLYHRAQDKSITSNHLSTMHVNYDTSFRMLCQLTNFTSCMTIILCCGGSKYISGCSNGTSGGRSNGSSGIEIATVVIVVALMVSVIMVVVVVSTNSSCGSSDGD
ncbi:glutamate receptor ionotropic, kainate glr-3-like [Penaeus chinensis]|uniref:glutamate receptor ionotropic, kainate glr-3-like n=1 Tax=Penaeus chinensis TaxID=139456 RepID=UPI001FB622FC|nr:glutamate receptor ionotropic, kainate glr-3-like [Penaeus chinensis]